MSYQKFKQECRREIELQSRDAELDRLSREWIRRAQSLKYSYHFEWLGRPIIQYPQDILAMQELIWKLQPDLIIETGIAHGGSIIFSASMLELNAACGGPAHAEVLAVDIDIRSHNREAIEAHPMAKRITMLQGSSTDGEIVRQVERRAQGKQCVLVCLDSNHTHDHVLAELESYAPLTTVGSYCIVFDTIVEHLPAGMFGDRPWGPGNSPKSAVSRYLASHPEFVTDESIDQQLMISVAPGGYLRRVR